MGMLSPSSGFLAPCPKKRKKGSPRRRARLARRCGPARGHATFARARYMICSSRDLAMGTGTLPHARMRAA